MTGSTSFYSFGKVLLTGEYVVLDGALALAIPVKFGQGLEVTPLPGNGILKWESFVKGHPWFSAWFDIHSLEILETTERDIAQRLKKLLLNALRLNPGHFTRDTGYHCKTGLDFDLSWGLGSSSTLVSNVAYWFGVDPMELFRMTFEGSGYDVACARSRSPLFYRLEGTMPEIRNAPFDPPFRHALYFVHLGKKQDSSAEVSSYRNSGRPSSADIRRISQISEEIPTIKRLEEFEELITEHETIIGRILGVEQISKRDFAGFRGVIKSLGAWGGDFVLVTWPGEMNELSDYLSRMGLTTFFSYDELIQI
jgi:mevalonate kinase